MSIVIAFMLLSTAMMIIELVTPTCVGLTMSVLFHAAAVTAAWVYFGPGWEMLVIVSVIVLKWIAGLCLLWKVVGRLALRPTHVKQFRAIVEGMVGTAITDLNPSGTALIDAECVSVSSEYGSVPLDSRIIVTRVNGPSVLVRIYDTRSAS